MLSPVFLFIGAIINLIGACGYIIDIIKGKVKPNRVTFLIWPLAPLIAFFAQINEGVGISSLFSLFVAITPLLVLIASFINKKSQWKLTKFDMICGVLSLIGLVLWQITKSGNIAIIFSILSDGLASLPTIVKAYKFPETEVAWPWLTSVIYAILALLTLTKWSFASAGFPIYYLFAVSSIYIFTQAKIGQVKKQQK